MRPTRSAMILATLLAVGSGCGTDRKAGELFGPSGAGQLVVQSNLIVDGLLPDVRLSRTTPPDRVPDAGAGEGGATVRLLTGGSVYEYIDIGAGRYMPPEVVPVLPETAYRLEVTTARGEVASAVTTTPPRFHVTEWALVDESTVADKRMLVTYAEAGEGVYDATENQLPYARDFLEARFAPPASAAVQAALYSLDPDSDFTIHPDFFSDADFASLERRTASPPLAAVGGYVRLPWAAVFFQGRYQVKIYSVDTNWYDFIRSDPQASSGGPGFGGNAGDSFERPVFHVNGAIGLFGSASVDSIGFRVLLP